KMERTQQMAKLCLSIFRADTERFEHFFLQLRLMYPNTAAADLDTVEHNIVGLGANFPKLLCLKQRNVFRFWSCERMMHRVPFVFLGAPFEERKICNPEEIPDFGSRRKLLHLCDAEPQPTEHFTCNFPFIRAEEDAVAFCDLEFRLQRCFLRFREKFHDRRFPFAVLDLDEGETFGAVQRSEEHTSELQSRFDLVCRL